MESNTDSLVKTGLDIEDLLPANENDFRDYQIKVGIPQFVAGTGAGYWTTKATGGTARIMLTGFSLNGFGYICDGDSSNEVNQYNDTTDAWATKATGGRRN